MRQNNGAPLFALFDVMIARGRLVRPAGAWFACALCRAHRGLLLVGRAGHAFTPPLRLV